MNDDKQKAMLKSSHDARLEFDAQLGRYMAAYQRASLLNDLPSMLDSLHGLFAMVSPYLRDHDYEELKNKLNVLKPYFANIKDKNLQQKNYSYVKMELLEFNVELRRKASHVFLPESSDDEAEHSVQAFIRKGGQR